MDTKAEMDKQTATEAMMDASHQDGIARARSEYPILAYFEYAHLPPHLRAISEPFCLLAFTVATQGAPRNAETSAALRKLLEAKDCAVRAAL